MRHEPNEEKNLEADWIIDALETHNASLTDQPNDPG